jgi:hypothetical protein
VALGVALNGVAATARVAGVALAGAFGGPIGLAVGALAIGLTLLAARTTEAEQTALANARGQEAGAKATEKLRKATEALANAHGKSRAEALAAAKAERELTLHKLASARAPPRAPSAEPVAGLIGLPSKARAVAPLSGRRLSE